MATILPNEPRTIMPGIVVFNHVSISRITASAYLARKCSSVSEPLLPAIAILLLSLVRQLGISERSVYRVLASKVDLG